MFSSYVFIFGSWGWEYWRFGDEINVHDEHGTVEFVYVGQLSGESSIARQ